MHGNLHGLEVQGPGLMHDCTLKVDMFHRVRGSATEVAGVHLFNGKLKLMAVATMKGQ